MDKNISKLIVPVVIAAVFFGAAGFLGGMQFQKSQTATNGARNFAGGNFGGAGQQGNAARRNGLGGGFTSGQIISKDSQSITIKITGATSTGSSKIVLYSPSTQIAKQAGGTADDLVVGSTVMVTGSTNSDGSISAQSISLRPEGAAGNPGSGTVPGTGNNQPAQGVPPPGNQPVAPSGMPGAAQ